LPARDSRAPDSPAATLRGRPPRRGRPPGRPPPAHRRLMASRRRPHRPHPAAPRAPLARRRLRPRTSAGSRLQHPQLGPEPRLRRLQRQPLRRVCLPRPWRIGLPPPRQHRTGLLPPRRHLRGRRTRRSLPQDRGAGTAPAAASLILRAGLPTRPPAQCQPLRGGTRWAPPQPKLRRQPPIKYPLRQSVRRQPSMFRLPNRDLPPQNLYDQMI
jgi:hypothetical protein